MNRGPIRTFGFIGVALVVAMLPWEPVQVNHKINPVPRNRWNFRQESLQDS